MNLKVLAAFVFLVGCACAVPLEASSGNSTAPALESDALMPAEDNSKKPSRRNATEKLNETITATPLSGKNESGLGDDHHGKHPIAPAATDEKMNHTMMPLEHHSTSMSISVRSTAGDAKNETHHHEMKPLNATSEAAIKRRAISEMMGKGKKKETVILKDEKDLLPEPEAFDLTNAAPSVSEKHHAPDAKFNTTIPAQDDAGLMEAILKHGLMSENGTHLNSTKPEETKKIIMRSTEKLGNATLLPGNSTVSLNKTAHDDHKTEHTRHAAESGEECDNPAHAEKTLVLLAERDTKPVDNSTTSKNETLSSKPPAKLPSRRRRDAYASSAPSQIRLAVRNKPAVRSSYAAPSSTPVLSSYEAPADPPATSSYDESPAAPAAKSSYEAPSAPAVRSSYKAPAVRSSYEAPAAPAVRSSYEAPAVRSSYEAPAAPAVRSSYEAPAAPTVRSSYEAPAAPPARVSYGPPASSPARSSYEVPAAPSVKSSYEAPAAPPVRSSYSRAAPVRSTYKAASPPVRSSYEAPASPPVRSSYETSASPPVRSSYEAPAAPAVKSSYEAPAAPPVRSSYSRAAPVRSTYKAASPPVRSSYEAPAAPAAKSSYEAPAVRSSYEAPAAPPSRSSSYQSPAVRTAVRTPVRSSYETPASPAVRSSYSKAPAAPAVTSYEAPAVASDSGY